ncbi:hypothetical protein FRC18_007814, partial [Serendipita sp. 400]
MNQQLRLLRKANAVTLAHPHPRPRPQRLQRNSLFFTVARHLITVPNMSDKRVSQYSNPTSAPKYDIVIVGAGVAGLSTAYHILTKRPTTKVLILEAKDRVGGRVHSHPVGDGAVDLGASIIHGVQGNPIMDLAQKLGLPYKQSTMNMRVIRPDGSVLPLETVLKFASRAFGTFFEWLPAISQEGADVPAESESVADRMFSKDSPLYGEGDSETREEEMEMARNSARAFQGWTGAPLDYVSLKWWSFGQDTTGGDAVLVDGYRPIIQWLTSKVQQLGAVITLESPVTDIITEEENGVSIAVSAGTESGQTINYEADYAVVTLPLGVLKYSPPTFNPPLPIRRLMSIEKLGFGLLNKVVLIYDSAWWAGLGAGGSEGEGDETGEVAVNILLPSKEDPTRLLGPSRGRPSGKHAPLPGEFPVRSPEYLKKNPNSLMIFNVHSQGGIPALAIFMGGEWGDRMELCSEEETKEWADKVVKDYFGKSLMKSIPSPTKVIRTTWRTDKYAHGSYSYIPVTPEDEHGKGASPIDQLELSRTLWGRLFWAGEHTELNQFASVHGAWTSGVREAEKVL